MKSLLMQEENIMTGKGYSWTSTIDVSSLSIDIYPIMNRYNDDTTIGHSYRVAELTLRMARDLRIAIPENEIYLAALFHDIGKNYVPLSILNAPRALNQEEQRQVQSHVVSGIDILYDMKDRIPNEAGLAAYLALYHHQCAFDINNPFKGYDIQKLESKISPDVVNWVNKEKDKILELYGDNLEKLRRIVSVVDCADAMYCPRPYKSGYNKSHLFEELRSDAKFGKLDLQIVEQYISGFEKQYDLSHRYTDISFEDLSKNARKQYIKDYVHYWTLSSMTLCAEFHRQETQSKSATDLIERLSPVEQRANELKGLYFFHNKLATEAQNNGDAAKYKLESELSDKYKKQWEFERLNDNEFRAYQNAKALISYNRAPEDSYKLINETAYLMVSTLIHGEYDSFNMLRDMINIFPQNIEVRMPMLQEIAKGFTQTIEKGIHTNVKTAYDDICKVVEAKIVEYEKSGKIKEAEQIYALTKNIGAQLGIAISSNIREYGKKDEVSHGRT